MWILNMAWRDSRGSRRRLALFILSMVLGVAALVAIRSFGESLSRAVDEQAKALLGADLSLESNLPFSAHTEALIDSLGGEQSRRTSFTSMAYFPASGGTRLATVRAIEGAYPYYGEVETDPASAADTYLTGPNALVDGSLMETYGAEVGDSVRIGARAYRIAGRLLKTPREATAVMLFSPRVYIPLEHLDQDLLATGSRAEYEVYFKFPEGTDVDRVVESIQPHIDEFRLGIDTVDEMKSNWNEGLTNLYRFLNLIGFVALLLGGLGVAGSIHVYIKKRIATVALLRCLGARSGGTLWVYIIQTFTMGLAGAILGVGIGVGLQGLLPAVLRDVIPVEVPFIVSTEAVLWGLGVGVGATVLFALFPLVSLRKVSPLRVLRSDVAQEGRPRLDVFQVLIGLLLVAAVVGFGVLQSPTPLYGLAYAGGILAVFGLLALTAAAITFLARRFTPSFWPYPWRQGLANLYRPRNQTRLLMLSLGFGTFIVVVLLLVQQTLLSQILLADDAGRPNLVFFDIQPDQLEGMRSVVDSSGAPVLDEVPIVTMRLSRVKDLSVDAIRADSTIPLTWAHTREYRSSFRNYLTPSEEVVAGAFIPTMPDSARAAPVSLEKDLAAELNVSLGDTLVFNVQGRLIETVVASLRQVDWRQMSTNFFVIFPEGVLETAPTTYVLLTHAPSDSASAALQAAAVQAYPNVSAIDLALVLAVVDSFFGRIAFVIRFMALFSIITAIIVLIGAVTVSRSQRAEESVLLKTLGASRSVVFRITFIEYLLLGVMAALTGLILAYFAAWALAYFVFDTVFIPDLSLMATALLVVVAGTLAVGLLSSRGIYSRPALEVLRAAG